MRLFLLTLLLVNFAGWSQTGSVSGIVAFTDSETAIGATVAVKGTQKFATTDENGRYEIMDLAYGTYTLEISSVEAVATTITVTVNKPKQQINVSVEKSTKILDEVKVNKVSEKREILDKGYAVNVIDTEDAAKRNLQTNDLLDRTVGVRVRSNGGLGASVNYNLNGMSGNSVRVFIDGIPITTYGASFNLNSIPPGMIDRIEVYKGVLPPHLADDAMGGAINVVLKKGVKNMLNASLSYGSFNTWQSVLNGVYSTESGFTVKASGFYNYSDNDYEVWGEHVYNILPNGRRENVRVRRFNDAYRSVGGRVEVGYADVKWADRFFIGYNGSDDYNEIQHGQYMTKPYKGRFTEADAHALTLDYVKKDLFTKGLEFNVNAVYSRRNEVVNDTVKWNYNWNGERAIGLYGDPILTPNGAQQGAPTINDITRDIISIRAGLTYNITDNHKIIFNNLFGTVNRDDHDELKSALERSFQEVRDFTKNVSSLGYELNAFNNKLKTSVFGKYYYQAIRQEVPQLVTANGQTTVVLNVTDGIKKDFGYGMAASYYLLPQLMVMASAEKAVRMPNENEIFGTPGENIVANPALRPENSNNFNLGFRVGSYKIGNHKITTTISGFVRNTFDKIVQAPSDRLNDAVQTLPFVNLDKTQSIGFEASLDYVFKDRLFLSVNTSKFNALFKKKTDAQGLPYRYYNRQLPNEPFFTLNANAQYNFKDLVQKQSELSLYYSAGYVDSFNTLWINAAGYTTPVQFIQDAGLSYTFPGRQFVVSFDATNLFDRQAFDNFAVQKPGRAFHVKVNYTISKF